MAKRKQAQPNVPMYKGQRGLAPVEAIKTHNVYAAEYLSLLCKQGEEARIWHIPPRQNFGMRGLMALRAGGQITIYHVFAPRNMQDDEIAAQIAEFWLKPVMFEIWEDGVLNGN